MPPARDRRADVVLLVEHDPFVRDLYRTALRDGGGFTVLPARDEIDALRRLAVSTPAAVVVNLSATRDDGRDLLDAMNLRGPDRVPVIAITDEPAALAGAGFACVVSRPVDLDALVEAILECLAERRAPNIDTLT